MTSNHGNDSKFEFPTFENLYKMVLAILYVYLEGISFFFSEIRKNGKKWRHYDVIMTSKLNFKKTITTFSNSSRNFLQDRTSHFLSYLCYFRSKWAFSKRVAQNSENSQKWRHYDVIMTSELKFKKKLMPFLDFSQHFLWDRRYHFFSYLINFLKYGENPDFGHFPYISLINPL